MGWWFEKTLGYVYIYMLLMETSVKRLFLVRALGVFKSEVVQKPWKTNRQEKEEGENRILREIHWRWMRPLLAKERSNKLLNMLILTAIKK